MGGVRAKVLLNPRAEFDVAVRLRAGRATIGEVYAFVSGLYFRGKVVYVEAFSSPPAGRPGSMVIVPGFGLIPPDTVLGLDQLAAISDIAVEEDNDAFTSPLLRDAALLDQQAGPECRYVLLGSVATQKYTAPLLGVFGERLLFPSEFLGRGDMSRGGLMLRCARGSGELAYQPVLGAGKRGSRPPKLEPGT
jgi:hypothetical protein